MTTTSIEWTDVVWNPTTGCDRVSPGCDHCYAMTMAKRLKGMGQEKYQRDGSPRTSGPGFGITEHASALDAPLRWRKPRKVFVNSMSDLFHDGVSDEFIGSVFEVMAKTPQHTYQVLTKRHGRMRSLLNRWAAEAYDLDWAGAGTAVFRRHDMAWVGPIAWPLPNVWVGVSVEDQKRAELRIPALLETPAAVRWLSCEPLLGEVDLSRWLYHAPVNYTEFGVECDCGAAVVGPRDECNGAKIGWVVAGGESGQSFRPVDPEWIRLLRDYCGETETPFLFKQWGGRTPKDGGRELDGRTHDEYPGGEPS